jgi:hypothetical protein
MNTDPHLLKKLAQTRRGKTYLYPLLGSTAILALCWVGLWMAGTALPHSMALQLIALGLMVALLAFLLLLRATRKNLRETATELDSRLDAHNQLETMVELKNSTHPLRIPQQERTEQDLGEYKPFPWTPCLFLASILLCIALGGIVVQVPRFSLGDAPSVEDLIPPTEQDKEKDFAALKLTKPESELRLKPLDEVAWEGTGQASNGFDDLSLSVYLNGEPVTDYPLEENVIGKSDPIEFSGSFFLDELNAEPYDVVSYHLTGHSKINGEKAREVVSIPQFIEVRPFNEDARILEPGEPGAEDNPMVDVLSFIHKVLEFELILNKAVFAARAADLQPDDPIFVEQISLLKNEQGQLKEELNRFLAEIDPELLSPNMMTCLRSAESFMDAAKLQLARIAPDREPTGEL